MKYPGRRPEGPQGPRRGDLHRPRQRRPAPGHRREDDPRRRRDHLEHRLEVDLRRPGPRTYRGVVHIPRHLKGCKNNTECDALLINTNSRTDTYPAITVRGDRNAVQHEASVSKVSAEQIFYMQQRGLTEGQAMSLSRQRLHQRPRPPVPDGILRRAQAPDRPRDGRERRLSHGRDRTSTRHRRRPRRRLHRRGLRRAPRRPSGRARLVARPQARRLRALRGPAPARAAPTRAGASATSPASPRRVFARGAQPRRRAAAPAPRARRPPRPCASSNDRLGRRAPPFRRTRGQGRRRHDALRGARKAPRAPQRALHGAAAEARLGQVRRPAHGLRRATARSSTSRAGVEVDEARSSSSMRRPGAAPRSSRTPS